MTSHVFTPTTDPATEVLTLAHQHSAELVRLPLEEIRLRWTWSSRTPGARQVAHQVRTRVGRLGSAEGGDWLVHPEVGGAEQIGVPLPGGPLAGREVRDVAVRIATDEGWTDWSPVLRLEGATAPEDLVAVAVDVPSTTTGPVPVHAATFEVGGPVVAARLVVTALGTYDARINGAATTDAVLGPGWTPYGKRLLVDTLDVTDLVVTGSNRIEIEVADGWYRGRFGFSGRTAIYGDRIGPLAQVEVHDGESWHVVTATGPDAGWRAAFGPLRAASIYDGTDVDETVTLPAPDSEDWRPVVEIPLNRAVLEPRATSAVHPVATFATTAERRHGVTVLDASQNVAGWVRLTVRGRAGQRVTVRHAEVLEADGRLHTAALRSARATDTYVLGRDGESVLEPRHTFHGFRYADVAADDGVEIVSAEVVAISSARRARSTFASSHATLDAFHSNVRWSQLDNFVSLPTDCPQRDERLGWTGDAQAFAPAASTLFDTESFFRSWLRDLELDQDADGAVASVVPNIIQDDMLMGGTPTNSMGRAGWADAATIVPLAVYRSYGDSEILARQLASMRAWVAHLQRRAGDDVVLPTEPFQYGDWLDPDAPADQPWVAKVSSDYVANAFYVWSARLLAQAEEILGDGEASAASAALADRVAAATWERWGAEAVTTQTGAALALELGIAPADQVDAVADTLASLVRESDGRIATGFLGTPHVLDALTHHGHLDEAYLMLLCRSTPSWLYQVDMGATTVWERWDAISPEGHLHAGEMDTVEGDSMISFNHYAYGAVIDWVYRTVAGLTATGPGYRTVRVAPRPATGLEHAAASIDTPYGRLAISWELTGEVVDGVAPLTAELTVPHGATAVLDLAVAGSGDAGAVLVDGAPAPAELTGGTYRITAPAVTVVAVPERPRASRLVPAAEGGERA